MPSGACPAPRSRRSRRPLVAGRSAEPDRHACFRPGDRTCQATPFHPPQPAIPVEGSGWTTADWAFLKRLVFISLFGLLLYFAWLISDVLLLAFAAVLVAVMLKRLADAIANYTPVPRSWSVAVVAALLVIVLIVGFLALVRNADRRPGDPAGGTVAAQHRQAGDRIGITNAFASLNEAIKAQSQPAACSRAPQASATRQSARWPISPSS